MSDEEDPREARLIAAVQPLSTETGRIGLHVEEAYVVAGPDSLEPVLVARFLVGDLAWSERVQSGDEMADLRQVVEDAEGAMTLEALQKLRDDLDG